MGETGQSHVNNYKENHKTLYEDTCRFFENMVDMEKEGYVFDECTTVDSGHGRIETRRPVMTSDIEWHSDKANWTGLKSLGMVESTREINGKVSHENVIIYPVLSAVLKRLETLSEDIGGLKL